MKTTRLLLFACLISFLTLVSCQRDSELIASPDVVTPQDGVSPESVTFVPYSITLTGPTQVNGNWQWIWAVRNNNPGNGNNGTAQDLSHWGFQVSSCFSMSSVVSAGYSANGTNWTNFTPTLKRDPSSCVNEPVIKFDFGTSGTSTSYYRLIVNYDYPIGIASGYYKSGRRTGCGLVNFSGMGCYIPN